MVDPFVKLENRSLNWEYFSIARQTSSNSSKKKKRKNLVTKSKLKLLRLIEVKDSYKRYGNSALWVKNSLYDFSLARRRNTVLLTLSQTRYWIVSFNRIVIRHEYGVIITVDPFSSPRASLRVQHSNRNDILFIVERRRGGGP